jgi:uncharacterized protein YggU (UPF0235/DUF167 family)
VRVRAIPRARKTEIGDVRDGALVVRIAAPPVDEAANQALIELLATRLNIRPSAVIAGVTRERVEGALITRKRS